MPLISRHTESSFLIYLFAKQREKSQARQEHRVLSPALSLTYDSPHGFKAEAWGLPCRWQGPSCLKPPRCLPGYTSRRLASGGQLTPGPRHSPMGQGHPEQPGMSCARQLPPFSIFFYCSYSYLTKRHAFHHLPVYKSEVCNSELQNDFYLPFIFLQIYFCLLCILFVQWIIENSCWTGQSQTIFTFGPSPF